MQQMTVLEILNRTKTFFEKKGVPDARLDAEYIISHGLGMKSRMDIYLNFEKPLTAAELDTLRPLVARRANREPLQHIIGDTSFRGFIIKCDTRALVPRPETEMLVDMAKESLKGIENPFIVEVGTGTAAISIACAKEIAGAKVLATDISEDALSLARENADANELGANAESSNLTFAQGDLLDAVTATDKIDCLIANLPYIPDGEKGKLQPEVDKFDPALALYGGPDGLDLVRKLLSQTEGKLNAGAPILLEIGSEQAEVLKNEAANYPWLEFSGIHKDYCGNIRFVSYKVK
ncbi:release factor glutamine methyltransferase [Fibrobacter sp. UWT2]|uniref:peptide chain release factor N(5)-glutamine methyltransferase n=1 Tax=Fibrobacter sp. UWT2 TaxID=1896224 RepID=UPI000921A72F|nr:peptide chain release factor N(5)-glutamine methyltransferase [Fibrobacter sp. UWT2]SHL25335.1 release factor glutamine methyltransferase [Fibrobacter sp. UWT2]